MPRRPFVEGWHLTLGYVTMCYKPKLRTSVFRLRDRLTNVFRLGYFTTPFYTVISLRL